MSVNDDFLNDLEQQEKKRIMEQIISSFLKITPSSCFKMRVIKQRSYPKNAHV